MITPGAASPHPLEGAPPVAWQSQIHSGCLDKRIGHEFI